jgi:pilus assembly protein Flp/PilA
MMHVLQHFRNFTADQQGATAVEYGLIVALIAATMITSLELLGGNISVAFGIIEEAIKSGI